MLSWKTAGLIFLLSLLVVGASACGEDDGNDPYGDSGDFDIGEMKLTVTGASNASINGAYKGQADINTIGILGIVSHDFGPQTFSFDLFVHSLDEGTYTLANSFAPGENEFVAGFDHYPGGDFTNSMEYHSVAGASEGTLTITKSTDSEVVGSFEITLFEHDDELVFEPEPGDSLDAINIKGTFRATPIIPL